MIEVRQLAKRFTQGNGKKARTVQAVDGVSFCLLYTSPSPRD